MHYTRKPNPFYATARYTLFQEGTKKDYFIDRRIMSKKPYQQWSVDDVSNWLVTIHLSNLVPVFERHDISGVTLPYVDETFMKDRLRMAKPAEVASLKGALAHLLESAEAQLQYPHRKPIPRPPPQAQKATRPGEGGVMKSPPVPMRQKSSTMPNKKNFFVPTAEVQLREPQLVIAPAQDLLDDVPFFLSGNPRDDL